MIPIVVYYHCLFQIGDNVLPGALEIIHNQMLMLKVSGLEDAASKIVCGINGGKESEVYAKSLLPQKAECIYHGLQSRAENLTIIALENWLKTQTELSYILYFHAKGATHEKGNPYGEGVSKPWRESMMHDNVANWKACIAELDVGYDIICSHWLWNMADGTQHIPAGNFLWVRSTFAKMLPSMYLRDRIKVSGIDNIESRYEAEVYWGNGPRPTVKSFRPNGGGGVP
jgi:hypothetical protein